MKTHLTYKVNGIESNAAYCGNNGRKYKYGLPLATPREFRNIIASDRCSHCERIYLAKRNKIRKEKGLPPVSSPFEGQEA